MSKKTSINIKLGITIFLVFLILKLINVSTVATWSWWWVTSPLWLPFAAAVALGICLGSIFILAWVLAIISQSIKSIFNNN